MSDHLLVFPDRDVAEEVAASLSDEGFTDVRVVREALAGEDDSEDHEWAVHVREEMVGRRVGPGRGRAARPVRGAGTGARRLVRPAPRRLSGARLTLSLLVV